LHQKLDPSGVICDVLSIGLQLGNCLAALAVASRANARPTRQTDNTLSGCSNVSDWGGSDASTTNAKPARDAKPAEDLEPDIGLHFISNHDDDLLLRDLVVRAAALDGYGKLPMERWLSDGAGLAGTGGWGRAQSSITS
jgi:hypothetical protein